jgi:hypothetical protein
MSPISFFSLRLELIRKGDSIGNGTGFIFKPDGVDQKFLVTNYHVLTARYPNKPDTLLPGFQGSPDAIRFSVLKKDDYQPAYREFSMLKNGKPISWLEHKHRVQGVDIVAIPIDSPQNTVTVSQNELGLVNDINFEVGSDLFIIGFPFGYAAGDFYPIWKRGTVASEPLFKPDGLSMFYIDSFTKPGMSGSPVFAMESRPFFKLKREEAKLFEQYKQKELSATDLIKQLDESSFSNAYYKKCFQFVGIFSGIIIHGDKDPNIGVVWQKQLIDEIFVNPSYVEHPFLA